MKHCWRLLIIATFAVHLLGFSPLQIEGVAARERLQSTSTTIDVPLDVVVLQDETGSMGGTIEQLRNLTPQIWDSLNDASTAGFRMSVVGYRDYAVYPWGDSSDWVYRQVGDFTTSRESYISYLDGLSADGGGDTPEGLLPALNYLAAAETECID